VNGRALTRAEWRQLVEGEHAIEFRVHPDAVSGVAFWVLRPNFLDIDAAVDHLLASGATRCDAIGMAQGACGFLVHEPTAEGTRSAWAEDALRKARQSATCQAWERAAEAATQAFAVEPTMTATSVAVLSFTLGRAGNEVRSLGILEMASRSFGADFAAQVRSGREALEAEFGAPSPG
jgi:hypothetical protein